MLNERLKRAVEEVAKLTPDTCPCKREVVLVEALHGYAELRGYRLEPTFIEPDRHIPFKTVKSSVLEPIEPSAVLAPLADLVGDPGDSCEKSRKINSSSLEEALRQVHISV